MDCKDGDGFHFEKSSHQLFKVLEPSLRKIKNVTRITIPGKDFLVPNFKAMLPARVKVRKPERFLSFACKRAEVLSESSLKFLGFSTNFSI